MSMDTFNVNAPQPAPEESKDSRSVTDLVLADLRARREGGKKKYGTELLTRNGRNALIDAYQEALDLVLYLRQEIEEREECSQSQAIDPASRNSRRDVEAHAEESKDD